MEPLKSISYDPSLDRIDVAIRAVVLLALGRVWRAKQCRAQIEMDELQTALILVAVEDIENWRTEEGLFKIIRICPFVVGFALELMRLYTYNSRDYRKWHYARNGGRHVAHMA